MPLEINCGDTPAETAGVPEVAPVKAGKPEPEATTLLYEGKNRPAFRVTVGGHDIVYTERLTVLERRALARAQRPEDCMVPEAQGFNQAAARVRQIDGEAIAFPAKDSQIEGILMELGDEAAEWLYERGIVDYQKRFEADAKN